MGKEGAQAFTVLSRLCAGTLRAKIPAGDKGIFNQRKNTRGDEIVEVVLRAPDVHDERTRELLPELAQVQTSDVRSEMWSQVQSVA